MNKKKILIVLSAALIAAGLSLSNRANGEDPDKKYYVPCFDTGMSGNHICYEYADPIFFVVCSPEQAQTAVPSWFCPQTAEWSEHPEVPIER